MKPILKKHNNRSSVAISRRALMAWTVPTVTAIALPSHAQTSFCGSVPVMTATVPSKCSGTPPVGDAIITLASGGADLLDIISINVQGALATDTLTLPSLPAQVSNTASLDLRWVGNGSDAVTCLPLSSITFEVTYRCSVNVTNETANFSLTTILAAALP